MVLSLDVGLSARSSSRFRVGAAGVLVRGLGFRGQKDAEGCDSGLQGGF